MAQFLLLIGPAYLIALALLLNWAYGWFDSFLPFTRNLHFRYISGMIFTVFALLMPAAFFLAAGRASTCRVSHREASTTACGRTSP